MVFRKRNYLFQTTGDFNLRNFIHEFDNEIRLKNANKPLRKIVQCALKK